MMVAQGPSADVDSTNALQSTDDLDFSSEFSVKEYE